MTTLFEVLKKSYLLLGQMEVSTATGGSTTTVIDTKLGDKYGDDDIVGSSIFIIRDSGGASAAPEGEISTVTGYVASTTTATVSPAYTAAVAVGDKFGIAKNIIDLPTLIEIANDALQSFGTIQLSDTSITTVEDITEYDLPTTLKYKIDAAQIQTNLEEDKYTYLDLGSWYVINSIPGASGLLIFNSPLPAGFKLKIIYNAEHPRIESASDVIAESIPGELAGRLVTERALEYQVRRTNGTDPFLMQTQNKAMSDVIEARGKFTQPKHKKPKYLIPAEFGTLDND
jgi:hypothetical protein